MSAPAFLFAYANERCNDRRYLRNLPEERRMIKSALRGASDAKQVALVECPNATIDEILEECQRYSGLLTVFHFAGHADDKTLQFEQRDGTTTTAAAGMLAEFLGGLGCLKLVVLNGCSTRAQAEVLLDRGVPAVVATSALVKDEVATRFAFHFYSAIGHGETIAAAFRQASSATVVKFTAGMPAAQPDALRALCRDIDMDSAALSLQSLWDLHGDEAATQHRLASGPAGFHEAAAKRPRSPESPENATRPQGDGDAEAFPSEDREAPSIEDPRHGDDGDRLAARRPSTSRARLWLWLGLVSLLITASLGARFAARTSVHSVEPRSYAFALGHALAVLGLSADGFTETMFEKSLRELGFPPVKSDLLSKEFAALDRAAHDSADQVAAERQRAAFGDNVLAQCKRVLGRELADQVELGARVTRLRLILRNWSLYSPAAAEMEARSLLSRVQALAASSQVALPANAPSVQHTDWKDPTSRRALDGVLEKLQRLFDAEPFRQE